MCSSSKGIRDEMMLRGKREFECLALDRGNVDIVLLLAIFQAQLL